MVTIMSVPALQEAPRAGTGTALPGAGHPGNHHLHTQRPSAAAVHVEGMTTGVTPGLEAPPQHEQVPVAGRGCGGTLGWGPEAHAGAGRPHR